MRRILNVIGLSFLIISGSLLMQNCSSKASNIEEDKSKTTEVKSCCSQNQEGIVVAVYYFHATHRCATCQAVEKVSKEYIEENYDGKVSFTSLNREEEENKALVEKYEIAGQSLILVFGEEVVNLTTEAFLNARTNPEKLQELIKSTIDARLN